MERSVEPIIIMNVTPTAMIKRGLISIRIFVILDNFKKFGFKE
jgi:aryl carrier-like protein